VGMAFSVAGGGGGLQGVKPASDRGFSTERPIKTPLELNGVKGAAAEQL
jgi:hypothetical protein